MLLAADNSGAKLGAGDPGQGSTQKSPLRTTSVDIIKVDA